MTMPAMSSRPTLKRALEEARSCLARADVTLDERPLVLDVVTALERALGVVSGDLSAELTPPPRSAEEERLSRVDAEAAQRRLAFAHDASKVLFDSPLDAHLRLQNLARIVVPDLADWCFCDLASSSGVERVAAATWNPTHAAAAAAMLGPLAAAAARHVRRVIDEGQVLFEPVHVAESTDVPLARSLMVLPLRTAGRTLGAVTLAFADSNRRYDETDRALAEDLAQRAAMAVEHAVLVADLERSIGARDELVGIVSHDLRSPLSTIRMAASVLSDDLNGTMNKGAARVGMILRATTRMEALVRDLLDVTALEGGGFTLDRTRHDAATLVGEAIELFAGSATQKGVTLASTVVAGIALDCDGERAIQVLSNLVGNALKFTPEGGSVTISAALETAGFCTFTVRDTGSGIGPVELTQVFDRFYQGKRKSREGAGLGLSIVKGIVEAHGGKVGVTSELGVGTSFWFSLRVP